MEALYIIGALFALAITINVVTWCADVINNMRLASRFGADIAALDKRLSGIDIQAISNGVSSVHNSLAASMGRLTTADGTTINVCPRCGAAVSASSSRGGIYISCSRPDCHGSVHVETTDKGFAELLIT